MAKKNAQKSASAIKLGSLVKDTITGFKGIAVGRTEFAFGCIHIKIQAEGLTIAGDPIPVHSFDDQRIEVLGPPKHSWPEPKPTTIKLGNAVRDIATGIMGVASAKCVSLDGHVNFIIEPSGLTPDGAPKSPFYVSAAHVVVLDKRELKVSKDSVATSGGPMARIAIGR